jgi:hypothetical protein
MYFALHCSNRFGDFALLFIFRKLNFQFKNFGAV